MVHTHNGILLSQEKNELTPSAATSADLAITIGESAHSWSPCQAALP